MNIGGQTNVQSATEENASVSRDMYNHPASLVATSPATVNGTAPRHYSNSSRPTRRLVGAILEYPATARQPTKEEFYQSYDPKIGLHTAAVLGGILVWLIVYLVYRTKCKKVLIRFFTSLSKKRKEKRHTSSSNRSKQSSMGAGVDTPSIVITSDKTQEPTCNHVDVSVTVEVDKPETFPLIEHNNPESKKDNVEKDTETLQKLPSLETDSTQATARWVKEQPLSIQSLQELPGSSSAYPPDLTNYQIPKSCPPVRDPRLVKSSSGLCLSWNKSLPTLSQNIEVKNLFLGDRKPLLADNSRSEKIRGKKLKKSREDLQKSQSKRVLPKLTITIPDSISTNPSGTNDTSDKTRNESVKKDSNSRANLSLTSGNGQPIPVTPTVKIQNYTSKRSARQSPSLLRQNSNDSFSSNSSADPADPLLTRDRGSAHTIDRLDCWHGRGSRHQIWPASDSVKETQKWEQSSKSLLSDENMTETVL